MAVAMSNPPLIALLTDFGASSPYVAQMKGVILGIQPQAQVIDISHTVPAQDIRQAAWILRDVIHAFPQETIYIVVVDPGVGSQRAILGITTDHGVFVGPDNGVLSLAADRTRRREVVALDRPKSWRPNVSSTEGAWVLRGRHHRTRSATSHCG